MRKQVGAFLNQFHISGSALEPYDNDRSSFIQQTEDHYNKCAIISTAA